MRLSLSGLPRRRKSMVISNLQFEISIARTDLNKLIG
jgi:hypothetical protein